MMYLTYFLSFAFPYSNHSASTEEAAVTYLSTFFWKINLLFSWICKKTKLFETRTSKPYF